MTSMLYTWQRGDPITIDEQYGKPELNPFWHHSSKKPLAWIDHTVGDFMHYTRSRKWVWMFMVLEFFWYVVTTISTKHDQLSNDEFIIMLTFAVVYQEDFAQKT